MIIDWEFVYKAFQEFVKGIEITIERFIETLKEISNGVIEVQEKFDMTEKVRKTWITPRKIVLRSQVMMRKPIRVMARSSL